MSNPNNESLFTRTFTKQEVLDRENFLKTKDDPDEALMDKVNIKRAIDKATATMHKDLNAWAAAHPK